MYHKNAKPENASLDLASAEKNGGV